MYKKLLVLVIIINILCLHNLSPLVFAESSGEANYFDVDYNNFNGLPTSESNDIMQTSDGYIWIASYSSLIRYDGKDFITIPNMTSILCLFVDSKERLWIGTNNDGVVLYEDNTFKFISTMQDIPSFSARSITETADGEILVGTALGMYKVDADLNFEVIHEPKLENAFISKLESFGENNTFGITKTGDLFELEGTTLTEFISFEEWGHTIPLCVLPLVDDNGEDYFWVGTNDNYIVELVKVNGRFTSKIIDTDTIRSINALMLDSQGRIWVGGDYGVGYINTDGSIVNLDYLNMTKSIENFCEDFEGNFWIVSSKEGVSKLNPTIFENVSANVTPTQMNGVELLDDYMYIASSNGIEIVNRTTLEVVENELTETYRGGYVRCVQKDNLGNLWFSTYTEDGLIKYNPKTEEITTFSYDQGLEYSRIRSTMTASDGKIWVATGNGIYVIENDEVIDYYGSDTGMLNLEILTLSEDHQGRIFAGTDGAGVYIFEDGELIKRLYRGDGLLSDIILRTETDPFNGGTWIITGNSIAFYDYENDYLRNITKFPYGNNYDLLFHEDTAVILCSNGIFFVDYDEMISDSDEPMEYIHTNHSSGLYSNAVANSFSKIEDGVLYMCGYQNITAFEIGTNSIESGYVPPITLPQIYANDSPVYEKSENYYYLTSNANFLEFDIFIPTYALQDYNVEYQLLGYDTFVHSSSYSSYIDPTYTNLPGGEYIFYVNLVDRRSGEIVNSNQFIVVKEYSFTENPVMQVLFVLLCMIAIFILVWYIIKQKMKKNQRQKDEATALFQDTLGVLSKVIDTKDRYTNGHSMRVAFYTKVIAKAMDFTDEEVESAYGIGLLHDIGKIAIPDEVLNKPGRLDKDEFEIMKTHASLGGDILESISAWPNLVLGAKYHHERYDGSGYSDGLKGEEIPLIARIICVADAFDAMYSTRVYRKHMDLEVIIGELENNSGTQFDPNIVPVFVKIIRSGEIDEKLRNFYNEDTKLK